MLERLATADGKTRYAKLWFTAERAFGNIKSNLHFRRFPGASAGRFKRLAAHLLWT
jgi:hypothetical protein